jgi:hypothetical protein
MERKKAIKILRYCIIGLVLLTVALFIISLYSLIIGLSSAISGGGISGLKLNKDNPNGDWTLTLNANPRNNGILAERIFLQLGLLNSNGEYIVRNSTSVYIEAGGQKPFTLVLTIPHEVVQEYLSSGQEANVTFELKFGISTLWDLVGLAQQMRIKGSPNI